MSQTSYIQLREVNVPTAGTNYIIKDKKRIATWGENNLYPHFLNYLYQNSSIHKGIIDGKVNYLLSMIAKIDDVVDVNGSGSLKLSEILPKILLDFELYNAFAVKVRKSAIYGKIIEYIDIANIRKSDDGRILYCKSWDRRLNVVEYADYFTTQHAEESVAIYYADVKDIYDPNTYRLIEQYYPVPPYSGAIDSIITDIEISRFNLSEIINGFAGGTIISLNNGIPETAEEERRIKNDLQKSITDRDKKGGVVVIFSNGKDNSPEINSFNGNNLPERYSQLQEDVIQKILVAHQISSPMLVGVKVSGQLGGSQELDIAKEKFEQSYIKPRLQQFLNFINQVFPTVVTTVTMNTKANDEDRILEEFDKCGIHESKVKVLHYSQEFEHDEKELIRKVQLNDLYLTRLQDSVLQLIIQENDINSIAKALGMNVEQIAEVYKELQKLGLITDKNNVTKAGKQIAGQSEVLMLRYKYTVRPGLGDEIIDTTRPFCRKLIQKRKLYTRQEINDISSRVGVDVWYYRGGWFHDYRDGKNYPYCRHYWYQVLTVESK